MRIGLVLPSIPAYSETFFRNKIKGLEEQGHKVLLFVNTPKTPENSPYSVKTSPKLSGSFIQVGFRSIFELVHTLLFHFHKNKCLYYLDKKDGLGFSQRIKNIINNAHIISEKLDWLHFGFGTMAMGRENVAKAMGAKMAVSFRGFDIGVYPLKHPGCYRRLWDKVDRIHVISADIRSLLYVHGYKDQSEIIQITPAIDTSSFQSEERKSYGIQNFITVARLHWKKGLEYTLEALALLKKGGLDFQYVIIGEGEEYERLRFAVYQLELEEHVIFKGKMAHETIKDELIKADIYLQYSIQEGFCNAVLEAQALGLLCVVSDAEGLSENVLDGDTGWVVPKCDAKELVEKIVEVMHKDPLEKSRISRNAQQRVKEHFSLRQQQLKFIEFYSK